MGPICARDSNSTSCDTTVRYACLQSLASVLDVIREFLHQHIYIHKGRLISERSPSRSGARVSRYSNSQTVAMIWPGGMSGNADASITRSPVTPITFPFESTTALGFSRRPIAPEFDISLSKLRPLPERTATEVAFSDTVQRGGISQVPLPWYHGPVVFLKYAKISSSFSTVGPSATSATVTPVASASSRMRRKPCTASSYSSSR